MFVILSLASSIDLNLKAILLHCPFRFNFTLLNMNLNNEPLVASPCLDICSLDDNDICIGCARHGNEISQWGDYSNSQKQAVLQRCKERNRGIIIPFSIPR
jgi:predicted Fe-S protein YdhL (DUF1289 family)